MKILVTGGAGFIGSNFVLWMREQRPDITLVNVNFLLPLADLMYGTLRRTLTAQETMQHGTREAAKARPVGLGEPAPRRSSSPLEKKAVSAT